MSASGSKVLLVAGVASALLTGAALAFKGEPPSRWWAEGEGRNFPAELDYRNEDGVLRVLLVDGPMETEGHPFFEPIGPNGRACVTCHQPADAMSLSARTARDRWEATGGKDPLFAAWDGSNCPSLPQGQAASHSLLLRHGLFRIQRPWPPRDAANTPIEPDFEIEVVRDPWGCNTGRKYGIAAAEPSVSVYRRPRPVANMKYMLAIGFAYDPKQGLALPLDAESGEPISGNLMADARAGTLNVQMLDAAQTHLELLKRLDRADMARIVDFESRVFAAQISDKIGGRLDDAGAEGGPAKLVASEAGALGSQGTPVWSEFAAWEKQGDDPRLTEEQRAFRASVARGAKVFRDKTFLITDSAGINSPIGFGNPVRNSCVFCHNMSQIGKDVAPGQVDLGTTNLPFADPAPQLPLFRITCKGKPHPHYGRVIHTTDPGYALTTGRCQDVGKITIQSMRGLSARAPFFANGSAKTIRDIVDYYERRYNIGYTEQEKQDLVNLMRSL